jgi:hypothetical protein
MRFFVLVVLLPAVVPACSTISSTTYLGKSTSLSVSNACLEVSSSSFLYIYPKNIRTRGGAIYIEEKVSYIQVNSTLFFSCHVDARQGSSGEGGAIWASCARILLYRTCFENCTSMWSGQALYVGEHDYQATRSTVFMFTTFYVCGRYPIDKGNPEQTAGVVWIEPDNPATPLIVQNCNWTAGLVKANYQNDAHGSAIGCPGGGISSVLISYATFLNNVGTTTFYYTATGHVNENQRPSFRLEYLNFVGNSAQGSSKQVISVQNANIEIAHCIFLQNSLTLFGISQALVNATGCVWDTQSPGLPAGSVWSNNQQGTTATYEPGVPVSACVVPPGTILFSATKVFGRTPAFAGSADWTKSAEVTPSAAVPASREIGASPNLVESAPLEVSDGLGRSDPMTGSLELKPSTDFAQSKAAGETGEFAGTGLLDGTNGLKGTKGFEATKPNSASQDFSPSHLFTRRRDAYKHHRPIVNLSGYIFFVFFYGDADYR